MGENTGIDPRTWSSIVGLANALANGTASAVNGQRQLRMTAAQRAKNQAMFDRDYYQSNLDRSENQEILRAANQAAKDQTQVNRAKAAVAGFTPEATLAQQNAVNEVQTGVLSDIAHKGNERKGTLARDFFGRDMGFNKQLMDLDRQHAEAWEQNANNAVKSIQHPVEAVAAKAGGKAWRSEYKAYMTDQEYADRKKQDGTNSTQTTQTI